MYKCMLPFVVICLFIGVSPAALTPSPLAPLFVVPRYLSIVCKAFDFVTCAVFSVCVMCSC